MTRALLLALLAGCGSRPEPAPPSPPPAAEPGSVCAWPHPDCCVSPPPITVVTLRELRAQRVTGSTPTP
jgi:hypothetical protein